MYALVIKDEKELLELAREKGLKILSLEKDNIVNFINVASTIENISSMTEFLCKLGIKTHLSGFRYLKYILENDFDFSHGSITTVLYPAVAKEFKSTPSKVERAIRHAIECVSYTPDIIEIYEKLFGTFKKTPTNRQFIAGCKLYLE